MNLSVELTMYPLQDEYLLPIKTFINHLNTYEDLKVETVPTATILMGDYDVVMAALNDAMRWSHETLGKAVFVAKFLPGYEAL